MGLLDKSMKYKKKNALIMVANDVSFFSWN